MMAMQVVRPPAVRHVTLWELLVWAFRDQMVEIDWPDDPERQGTSGCGVAAAQQIQELGCHVDGGLYKWLTRDAHPDALAVGDVPAIVATFARTLDPPEWPTMEPLPRPTIADRSREVEWRTGRYDGQDRDIVVRRERHIVLVDEVVEVRRRRNTARVRLRRTGRKVAQPIDAPYCPLTWRPTADWVAMQKHVCREFWAAIEAVWEAKRSVTLRDHVLTGLGIENPIPRTTSETC